MPAEANQFRLVAYLGSGAIFIGIIVFAFLAFPDQKPLELPFDDTASSAKRKTALPSARLDSSTEKISALAEGDPSEAEENDSILAGEVIIHGKSKDDLGKIFSRALKAGGNFKSVIPELLAARIQFPSKQAAKDFRDSLGEGEISDSNYVVLAPEILTDEDLINRQPTNREETPDRESTSSNDLQPFGDKALEFLGVTEDNSTWGTDLTVAILDSGVYPHENLTGTNIRQLDLVESADDTPSDYTGHGTAVADIINLVTPGTDMISVRVLDSQGVGDTFTVAQGVIAAADAGANVINLSLGSYGDSAVLRDAINYAVDNGAAVVAASGNDGIQQVSYPAAYDNVLGVTAIDASGQFADFSNYGDGIDLSAPGVGVHTAWEQDGQVSFSGTSAATPFVSASILATMSRNPGYTIGQAVAHLQQTATDPGTADSATQTGSGILNLRQ